MPKAWLPVQALASVAWIVRAQDPAVVGVPDTVPSGLNASPGGREPAVTAKA